MTEHEEEEYVCRACDMAFDTEEELERHKEEHH